jgi:uncharacterized damage-inducible protein DinB
MNDDFVSLFAYNRWADRRVLGACRKLTAEHYGTEPVPGWSSVRSSIVHIAVVTEGWLSGLEGESDRGVLTEADLPTVDDAERLLDWAAPHFLVHLKWEFVERSYIIINIYILTRRPVLLLSQDAPNSFGVA